MKNPMAYWLLLLVGNLVSFAMTARAENTMRMMTYNLHGYHPTGEAPRFLEKRDGSLTPAPSHLFYFSADEIKRGHTRRLDGLACDLKTLLPDVLMLQEVGAGFAEANKDCNTFLKQDSNPADAPGLNSAVRLAKRLQEDGYQAALACRGNVGWYTGTDNFAEARPVRRTGVNTTEPVYQFGENPFPHGLIVEGLAVLYRRPWVLLESLSWNLPINSYQGTSFLQVALLQRVMTNGEGETKPFTVLVANLHSGHKLAHFEAAVALRIAISKYIEERAKTTLPVDAVVIGGDMNAYAYRPVSQLAQESEISMVPYEVRFGQEFDFSSSADDAVLKAVLQQLNSDSSYKPWASVLNTAEAETRIEQAIQKFKTWRERKLVGTNDDTPLVEALSSLVLNGKACLPPNWGHAACNRAERIDHMFTSQRLTASNAYILYNDDNWTNTDGFSDHPGLVAEFLIK